MNQIFEIELISTEILSNLRLDDLLQCALVSKNWNRVARDVTYKKWNLQLKLYLSCPQVELRSKEKLEWLMKSKQNIFRTLKISFRMSPHEGSNVNCRRSKITPETPVISAKEVLDLMLNSTGKANQGFTTLTFSMMELRFHPSDKCPLSRTAFLTVNVLLEKIHSEKVDTILLDRLWDKYAQFLYDQMNQGQFRYKNLAKLYLKYVNMDIPDSPETVLKSFLQGILLSAENLREFWGHFRSNIAPHILEVNKGKLTKNMRQTEEYELNQFENFVNQKSELQALDFTVRSHTDVSIPQINRCIQQVFASSCNSLVILHVEMFVLHQLTLQNPVKMPNVRCLNLKLRLKSDNENAVFQLYPLSEVFPGLEAVVIDDFYRGCRKFDKVVPNMTADSIAVCDSVRNLVIYDYDSLPTCDSDSWESVAKKFPNLTTVLVNRRWRSPVTDSNFTNFIRKWLNWMEFDGVNIPETNPEPVEFLDRNFRRQFSWDERNSKEFRRRGIEWMHFFYPTTKYTLIHYRKIRVLPLPLPYEIAFGMITWKRNEDAE